MLIATAFPAVGTPTTPVITPLTSLNGFTLAPLNGAYPLPGVEARDTMIPPLGSWFSLISPMSIIGVLYP